MEKASLLWTQRGWGPRKIFGILAMDCSMWNVVTFLYKYVTTVKNKFGWYLFYPLPLRVEGGE
jgi:hypothetical protein